MSFETCISLFLMLNIKEDILKNAANQVPIDFHSISFLTMEVNRDQQLFGSSEFFKISSFMFNIRRSTYTGLE